MQAEELNVVTGANKVAYSDLQAEQMSAATAKPALALDVSALGGMYAGRITMVGTENGVGVKMQVLWKLSAKPAVFCLMSMAE